MGNTLIVYIDSYEITSNLKKESLIGSHFLFCRAYQMTSFDHRIDWDHKVFCSLLNWDLNSPGLRGGYDFLSPSS
jgi:hypothetical protein